MWCLYRSCALGHDIAPQNLAGFGLGQKSLLGAFAAALLASVLAVVAFSLRLHSAWWHLICLERYIMPHTPLKKGHWLSMHSAQKGWGGGGGSSCVTCQVIVPEGYLKR